MPLFPFNTPRSVKRRFSLTMPIALSAMCVAGTIGIIGILLFVRGQALMREQLKERLRSTAAAAAMQFDGDVLDAIRDPEDTETPAFRNIVERLQNIRATVPNIRYAYIMRQTEQPGLLKFIADADMLLDDEVLDVNRNGEIDPDEEPSAFDEEYDATDMPALQFSAFVLPSVDDEITVDRWGKLISGYAPIHARNGTTVATLGLDMNAEEYVSISQSIFSPVALLLIALATVTVGAAIALLVSRRQMENFNRIEAERSGLLRLAFHQLGGPLSIIKWSLELLHDDAPAAARQVLSSMDEGVSRLNNILHTLHEADLVHEGKVQYKAEEASLNDITRMVVEEFQSHADRRKQHITMDLGTDIAMKLDRKLIAGVIRELINNAVDFSFDGGEITVKTSRLEDFARVDVIDHGCGIPKEDLPRIFAEFERGSNAATYKPDGTGLGLYIVQGIVERAGGTISIKSREGHGTAVSFQLPIAG